MARLPNPSRCTTGSSRPVDRLPAVQRHPVADGLPGGRAWDPRTNPERSRPSILSGGSGGVRRVAQLRFIGADNRSPADVTRARSRRTGGTGAAGPPQSSGRRIRTLRRRCGRSPAGWRRCGAWSPRAGRRSCRAFTPALDSSSWDCRCDTTPGDCSWREPGANGRPGRECDPPWPRLRSQERHRSRGRRGLGL